MIKIDILSLFGMHNWPYLKKVKNFGFREVFQDWQQIQFQQDYSSPAGQFREEYLKYQPEGKSYAASIFENVITRFPGMNNSVAQNIIIPVIS